MICLLAINVARWISLHPSIVVGIGIFVLLTIVILLTLVFRLNSSRKEKSKALKKEKKKNKEQAATLTNQKSEIGRLNSLCGQKDTQISDLGNNLSLSQEMLARKGQELEVAAQEIQAKQEEIERGHQHIGDLEDEMARMQEGIATLQNSLAEKDGIIENIRNQNESLTSELNNSETLANEQRQRANQLSRQLNAYRTNFANARRAREDLQTQFTEETTRLRNELAANEEESLALQNQINSILAEKDELANRVNGLNTTIIQKDDEIRCKDETIENLTREKIVLEEEIAQQERALQTLQREKDAIKNEADKKQEQLIQKDAEIGRLANEKRELEEQLRNVPDVTSLLAENESNISRLQEATAELDQKENELREQTELAQTRGDKILTLQEELRAAQRSIEDYQDRIGTLENDIETLKREIEDLKRVEDLEPADGPDDPSVKGDDEVEPDRSGNQEGDESSDKGDESEPDNEPQETDEPGTTDEPDEGKDEPEPEPEHQTGAEVYPPAETPTDGGEDDPTPVTPILPSGEQTPHRYGFIPAVTDDDENADLPSIDRKTGKVKRSILQVIDVEHDPPITIDSDEFFDEEPEKIERVARMLAEADETGREAYLCACCETPVKIAKRDYGYREVLFFSHCRRDAVCEWKQDHSVTRTPPPSGTPIDIDTAVGIRDRRRMIKDLIVRSLQSEVSKAKGVSDVEEGKRIRSQYRFISHRNAGIYARYNERNLVFELQTRDVLMNSVVNKDIFYRLHDHHVIWIFGADEGTGYDYIIRHVNMNTMFANRRNVFIMDKEAMDACEERGELVLKCNYLDPDNKWHYRSETTGSNGILITLDELQFDEDMCKPYYFDANTEYFRLNPEAERLYEESIVTREKLLQDLEATYEGRMAERRRKRARTLGGATGAEPNHTPAPPAEPEPEITPTENDNRFLYYDNGKYGIVDGENHFIIPCDYDGIECWTSGKYRVLKIDRWGVVDEDGNTIVDIKYVSMGDIERGKALVQTASESYYIDENGKRLADETIKLQNGWTKFRFGAKWGIMDKNKNVIVEPVYDEIGSFRRRLIGIRNGGFQKLVPRFEYRLKMHCTCTDNTGNRAVYDMKGLVLIEQNRRMMTIGRVYKDKIISNISFNKNAIYVNSISPHKENVMFEHVDNDYDFAIGETLTGTVIKRVQRKVYIQFADGRMTYTMKSTIEKAGKQPADYARGKEITLQKTGYDSDYERTMWKMIE